jgi:two-component system LytT family response regulator
MRERMAVLESRLDPEVFFRTHRSAIVRLARVRAVKTLSRYEHTVSLASGARVPLSRDRKARLASLLGRNW